MTSPAKIVTEIVDRAVKAIEFIADPAPIGCHYFFNDPDHEISLFVSSTEVVGGPRDGERIEPRFFVDMIALLDLLDEIESLSWQPNEINDEDDLGNHASLTGVYRGQRIWLRILARTPEDFLPGCLTDHAGNQIFDVWNSGE